MEHAALPVEETPTPPATGGGENVAAEETVATEPTAPSLTPPTEPVKKREGKVDITPKGEIRFYATGRRKEAIARVWLIPGGTGQIVVNGRPLLDYVTRISLYEEAIAPLRATNTLGMFDVRATVRGGGLHGQAGALCHGIARALVVWNEELRPILRRHGLLTRDPRAKERKKYGRKRARRGFQFRKR
jgi:small subunit ribosomal protein S9